MGTCGIPTEAVNVPLPNNIGGDGLYTITERNIDTAGNRGGWVSRTVERDTVSPNPANLNVSKIGDILGEYLSVSAQGEAYTKLKIEVSSPGLISTLNPDGIRTEEGDLNSNGEYSINNLIGKLLCEGTTYTVKVNLVDRAGNISQQTTGTVTTLPCPRCSSGGNGQLTKPIHSNNAYVAFPYGYSSQYYNGTKFHDGIDYNGVPEGTPVYAAKSGTVAYANYQYTNANKGKNEANYVMINHGNNQYSLYVHLMNETSNSANMVSVGDQVDTNTILGRLGNTGNSSGPHLHFEFRQDGINIDPTPLLGVETTNLTPEQFAKKCTVSGSGGQSSIEAEYKVRGGDPVISVNSVPYTKKEERTVNLNLIAKKTKQSDGSFEFEYGDNFEKSKLELPQNANIWIISHGLNDSSGGRWADIGANLKDKYPNDVVLTLNWSDASKNNTAVQNGHCRAGTWISEVAKGTVNKLKETYGENNITGSKIKLIGHSLGSLLSSEISTLFPDGIDTVIALDPPSDVGCGMIQTEYKPNGFGWNTGKERKDFGSTGRFNRAFVGRVSIAGNQSLAKTAQESFRIDFEINKNIKEGNYEDGREHQWVVETFQRLIRYDDPSEAENSRRIKLRDDKLFLTNDSSNGFDNYLACNSSNNCHDGKLDVNGYNDTQRLETKINGFTQTFNKTN